MPEIKNTFVQGKMNKDLDERIIPNGEYRDAKNIEISTSDDSDIGTAQNILGNTLFNNLPDNTPAVALGAHGFPTDSKCVGAIADEKNDVLYWFVTSNAKDIILEYKDDGTITPVIIDIKDPGSSGFLMFEPHNIITGINIIDNLLFWTDNKNEPKKINVDNCKLGTLDMFTTTKFHNPKIHGLQSPSDPFPGKTNSPIQIKEKHITVIKKKPNKAPVVSSVTSSLSDVYTFDSINWTYPGFGFGGIPTGTLLLPGDIKTIVLFYTGGSYPNPSTTPYDVGDILLLSQLGSPGNLPYNAKIKVKVESVTPQLSTNLLGVLADGHLYDVEILEIDGNTPTQSASYNVVKEIDIETIFEKDFVRFATRYKYIDGEYSAFSPFTQPVFLAGRFGFHPTKDPYNIGMANRVLSLKLQDLITPDIPDDVVQVDILFKKENSTVIYSIDSIRPNDPIPKDANGVPYSNNYWHENTYANYWALNPNYVSSNNDDTYHELYPRPGYSGEYTITVDNIHAALPENQLLRPWDNVPRKALAQEITANRIIYANYLQNYTLKNLNEEVNPDIKCSLRQRRFWDETIDNQSSGKPSIKSLRTYELGVVYGDKYGRETPVFTSKDSSIRVPWDFAGGTASSSLHILARLIGPQPEWAHYYKWFIKQTEGEYYNLSMDRVYRADEEENLWLSFPSSDRNKLQEGDYLILKKQVDLEEQIPSTNKVKVIDIKNEAPESIKYHYIKLGSGGTSASDLAALFPDVNTRPAEDVQRLTIDRKSWIDNEGGMGLESLTSSDKLAIQFQIKQGGNVIKSQKYDVSAYELGDGGDSGWYRLSLKDTITNADSWVESSSGVLNSTDGLTIIIYKRENKPAAEFEGRFFVKIISNVVTQTYLLPSTNDSLEYQVTANLHAFWLADDNQSGPSGQGGLANTETAWQQNTDNVHNTPLTNTENDWSKVLKFDGNQESSYRWFIDNTYMASAQEDTTPSGTNYNDYGGWDADRSGRMWKGLGPNSNGKWQVEGLEGIVRTSSTSGHYRPLIGQRTWTSVHPVSSYSIPGNSGAVWDNTYEPSGVFSDSSGNDGVFMHLSFSSCGVDLHDGDWSNLPMSDDGNYSTNEDVADHSKLHTTLQWIMASSTFSENYTVPCNNIDEIHNGDNKWGSSAWEAHLNQFNPAYTGGASVQGVINKLVAGSRFRIDGGEEIFEIQKVTKHYLYNHTAWRKMQYWDGNSMTNRGDTVEDTVHDWIDSGDWGDSGGEEEVMRAKIVDFGRANNRRVTYVIELDKDPTDPQYNNNPLNTVDDDNGADENNFKTFRFIEPHSEPGSSVMPVSPAIFETEPKEEPDLNIYYEASEALPIELSFSTSSTVYNPMTYDNDKGHMLAPIGSRVQCSDSSSLVDYSFQNDQFDYGFHLSVDGWDGNILTLKSPGLKVFLGPIVVGPTTFGLSGGNYVNTIESQSLYYKNKTLFFFRDDYSFTKAAIFSVEEIQGDYITKVQLYNKVHNRDTALPYYNCYTFGNGVESNRIRDDFNESYILNGVKASTVLEEPYEEERRKNGLIYSGIYNSTSGINNLNQFIQADKITKDLLPTYGSIQKLFTRNDDLVAFCEDKVVKIAADKDVIYNADGNTQLLASNKVLGQSIPFRGEYGISKNPESFAKESFRAYFADKKRGAVLRLSMDGLTPISDSGMRDYFRDNLKDAGKIFGSYDEYKKDYNLTIYDAGGKELLSNINFDTGGTFTTGLGSDLITNGGFDNYVPGVSTPAFGTEELLDGPMDSGGSPASQVVT